MLKLMKHEFRATARIMLPLCLLVLATAVGGNLAIRQLMEADNGLLNILGMLLLTGFVIAIVAVCIMSLVVMVSRFHKNLLQDEGYVMLTLPVSIHQHVWSKLLVSVAWFAATVLVVLLAVFILVYELGMVQEVLRIIGLGFRELLKLDAWTTFNGVLFVVELLTAMFVACAAACLMFYAAMAIGHSFSSHKVLLSIVFFFAIQAAMSTLSSVLMMGVNLTPIPEMVNGMLNASGGVLRMTNLMMAVSIVGCLVQGTIYYLLTVIPLTKRLNLE